MKKTLFSLAFVAASGAYVATAGHMFGRPDDAASALATDTALPATMPLPIAPPAAVVPLVTLSRPAPSEAPQVTAQLVIPPVAAEIAPVPAPPLPRPRPTPPRAPATIQPAASINATSAGSASGYADGNYTGGDENAYYGRVQVQVTVTNHQIAGVRVLDYPQDRRTSRYINSQALPMLKQEVIAAQNAYIDIVSGATLTSEAYIRSLGGALAQAGGGNA